MNKERSNFTPYETFQAYQQRRQGASDLLNPLLYGPQTKRSSGRIGDEIWRDVLKFLKKITGRRCPQGIHPPNCRCGRDVRAMPIVIPVKTELAKAS